MPATGSPGAERRRARVEPPVLPGSPRFRRRLTLAFVLVGAATGAVLVAASFLMISTYRHRSFERTARREAELGLLPGPVRFTPQRLDDLVHEYRRRGGVETVVVTPASVARASAGARWPSLSSATPAFSNASRAA